MSVKISGITSGSRAEMLGIEAGDTLVSINGSEITDILDFRFYEINNNVTLVILSQDGRRHEIRLRKGQYEPIGLEFDTYLMDKEHSCRNKCVFCFIDQLPKGMRESLYFKDDDDRLSFFFGNYITLTNMNEEEIKRIIKLRISPINISVHTMNPELRCRMMNNRFAGDVLRFIPMLTEAGIKVNAQLVLCPGLNDGKELEFTISELFRLGENLQSLACVPVGLTAHREGLYPLTPYDAKGAGETIDIIESWAERFREKYGARCVYASDEFYLLAERELPDVEYYEGFEQIDNGVGMIRNLQDEFDWALEDMLESDPDAFKIKKKKAMVTGTAVNPFIRELAEKLHEKAPELEVDVLAVKNNFFGGGINITGLLTGRDITEQLKDLSGYDELLLPSEMVKADEDILLDDVTLDELSERLHVPVRQTGTSGESLLRAMLGLENMLSQRHYYYQQVD